MAQDTNSVADVQKIKEEFIELHNQIPELISNDALEPLLTLVKDSKVDPDYLANKLRTNLKDALLKEFLNMWNSHSLDVNLAILEEAKREHADGEKAWRPTGKTPQEQVRDIEYGIMKKKIAYLEDLIKEQTEELSKLLPVVEKNRESMRNVLQQRKETLEKLKTNHESYKEEFEEAGNLKVKLYDKLMDISSK